jgi:hypothetical protein
MYACVCVCVCVCVCAERALFYRERDDGLFYLGTYMLYKSLQEVGIAAFMSAACSAAVFYGACTRAADLACTTARIWARPAGLSHLQD